MIHIYTDGACSGNGKEDAPGGFGVVAIDEEENILYEFSDSHIGVTNNRMEMWAVLHALNWVKNNNIEDFLIYSDSAYTVNTVNDWIHRWAMNNWIVPSTKKNPANFDLVQLIFEHVNFSTIKIQKIKGHAGHKWNEYADGLAVKGKLIAMEAEKKDHEKVVKKIQQKYESITW